MDRTAKTLSKAVATALSIGTIAGVCLLAAPALAQDDGPPPEVIATLVPVYHEGHAAYWYNGRWYYRDGARWNYYHDEPKDLRDHRMAHPPVYHQYRR